MKKKTLTSSQVRSGQFTALAFNGSVGPDGLELSIQGKRKSPDSD